MAESILAYKLRTRFSPDMQFSQNHIAKYGASFKAQKVMWPPLKCQIFSFLSKFVLFTQLFRKQIQFSKILCQFLVYMAKYPRKKIKNIQWVDSEKNYVTDRQTDRQTDRWTDDQNWFYWTSSMMEVWSCFSETWE